MGMTIWFKEVSECPDCKFSDDGQELKLCEKHDLTPDNMRKFLDSKTWDV